MNSPEEKQNQAPSMAMEYLKSLLIAYWYDLNSKMYCY